MAEKKSWRDYSKNYSEDKSTDKPADEEKTGGWRDYSKSYSSDTETQSRESSGSWRDYSTVDTGSIVGSNVVNRVNNWLNSHNEYLKSYQDRYSGRKWNYEDAYVSDSADWLDTFSKQHETYRQEAKDILAYLDQHKDYLDAGWVNSIRNTLISGSQQQRNLVTGATKDNEWWRNFSPNEEQIAAGYTAEKLYNEWSGGQKQYADDLAYDVAAGEAELEGLKKEREAYLEEQAKKQKEERENESFWDSLGRWLGTTPDTTIPLAGASGTPSGTSTTKYDKLISEKEEQIKRAKYVQGYEGFMGNMDAADYGNNSQYVSTRTDVAKDDARWGLYKNQYDESKLFGDFLYDYINKNEDALSVAMVNDTASNAYFLGFDKGFLQTMSNDEIGVYNYLYKTQGQESANAFLSFIESDLEGRRRQQEQARWAEYAKESPVASSVFSTLISPLKGLSYISQAADMMDDGKMKDDAAYNRFTYIPSTIRSQVSSTIEDSGKWGKVGSFAYNTGMSMADFLFTTAVSGGNQGLSLAIMGSGAAADATLAAKDRGLDDGQAFALGTIAGLAEVAMEKISLGAWLDGDMSEGALRYVLKNALSEGGEEASTSVVNLLADVIIAGDKSEWNMAMQAYMDAGKSEGEAFGLVLAEQAAQIGLDALGGMLSGAAIGGGTYAGTSAVAGTQYGDIAKNKESAQQLVSEGLELNPDSQYIQKLQGKVEKGKNLTGMQVRNILAANKEAITTNDMQKIQQAAEKRLTDLGQTENVSKVAEIATKWATGQEITRAEKKLLTHSQYGSRVANELLPENIDSDNYSTEWAESIGTESVNKAAYNKKAIRDLIDAMASAEDPAAYKSLEERAGTETSFKVSKDGQATIRKSGETIDLHKAEVAEFVKDKKGNIVDMVIKADGKEVKASEIDYADGDQSYLFEAVSKIENISTGAATAIIRDYDPSSGQTVGEYLNGIDEGFTYGYYGYTEADLKAGNFTTKLTDTQMKSAYVLGQYARQKSVESKTEAHKNMRTAAQAEAEKAVAEGKEAPKDKNLTITYNEGGGKVVSIDKAGIKDAKRSGAVEVAKILHKLGLGTKVEFFKSYLSKDENGNEIRVFKDDNGVEQRAYSGVYRKSDGTIRIDLDAYNGRGLTLNALSHELTHFIQQWSDEKYKALADFLIKAYEKTDMTMHERVLREQARLEGIRGEKVSYDEAFDEVVANAMSKMFDDGKLVERLTELKAQDEKLARKLWQGFKKILAKFLGIYEEAGALFHDAADLMAMKETFEQLQNMFAEAMVEASGNYQASQQIGLEIDAETESVSPAVMHSEHTWTESDYVQERDKAAKEIAKAIGVSEKKAKDYIDSINSIAKMIAEDRSRLDYFSSPGRTSFVGNVEYGGSFDFSTLCKKRRLLTGTFTAIQKALPNTALTANEILDIRNRMKKAGLEVSCGLCYVEGSRANMGQFAKEFLRLYKQYYPDAWQPNMADVNTPDGIEWVRINHPECYEQYEYFWNHYGTLKDGDKNLFASQQKPKLYQLHTEYKGEILQKFKGDDNVEEKNLNGGIRLQSFSDFEIVHLIDTMQIIMDMSRVGLAGQAYTKVPDFAWALGDTGLKINLSLIAKGVDANGKLIFDDVEGMPIAEAMKLRDHYSKNVGTILVAFNDEQLLAAMADSRVDFIIPFHRSQWKKSQYEAMGLPAKTKDYTFMQNEKFIKPQFHEYRGRMVQDKATNYMPNEYWDFSKSGKENAETYLEMCARNNKRPKFYKLLQNNGDGSYSLKADGSTDGYWKLLIDFKMYDNEGTGSPQMPVKPEFNMEEANRMLNDYAGGHSNFPVAQGIVDSFVKDYKASHKGEQYSSQETDIDTDADLAYDGVKNKTAQEDKANGRREESAEDFDRRTSAEALTKGQRGRFAYAYRPHLGTLSQRAKEAREELKKIGIPVFIYEKLETNRHGITINHEKAGAAAIPGVGVFIPFDADVDSMEIVGHEGFHFLRNSEDRSTYISALVDNIDFASAEFISYQTKYVQDMYFDKEVETDGDGFDILTEEIYAYITGDIHSGDPKGEVHKFLRDYDAAKAAWDDLIKKQAADSLYSSQETDADNAPTFYSKMGKVVDGMKQEKFGASSVISMLRGRGVKAEEIRWSGIQAFLDGKKSVTKAELLEFIKGSMLHIEEQMLDGTRAERAKLPDNYRLEETENGMGDPILNLYIDDELVDTFEQIFDGSISSTGDSEIWAMNEQDLVGQILNHYAGMSYDEAYGTNESNGPKWGDYKLNGGENYRELVFKMPGSTYTNIAMQGHWGVDAQGVLAHARIQDFNTFLGKMLFIEEIQSDWHNEGAKNGYGDLEAEKARIDAEYDERLVALAKWQDKLDEYNERGQDGEYPEDYDEVYDEYMSASARVEDSERRIREMEKGYHTIVPDAPFKGNYHEFVIKRLLRMAAEEGYDSIGWTTADIQSDRWSDEYAEGYRIEYDQDIPKFLKKYGKQWDSTVGKTVLDNGTEVWSMAITDSMKDSVLKDGQEMYSEHYTDYSNRSLLANAFESITNGSEEYKLIQEYKGRIKILNEYEEKLSKLNAEIREIRFTEGKYDAKKLKELETQAKNVAESINRHDKKLLSLEASEPLRKVIERERKKEAQKTRDHVKEIQQNKKARAEQTELRHKIRKAIRDLDKLLNRGNKKANVKEDMKGFVSKALELADYLFTDHVSNDDLIRNGITVRMTPREAALVKETEDILSQIYDNFGNLTAEEYARLDAKRKSNMDKLRDLLTAQRNERLNTPVYNLFNDLVTEYAALKNSKQEAVKAAYDPNVERFLREYMGESNGETDSDRKSLLQNMRVADMTTKELEHLLYAYTMVMTSVRDANKLHIKGKTETIEQMAGRIMGDFSKRKAPDGKVAIALRNLSNKMGWDYEKLFYALDRIGSEAFAELVMNIANSENIVMQDVMEAAAFRDEMVKNYGFNNWDVNKKIDREFLDNTGKKFNLTLGQMMSLYAYSRRDGAWDHIEYGGFVFGEAELTNPKPADSYKLSKAQCEAITNLLTKEQKGYVEDMQKFLSETMGAKGNEVSMQLYGIKMFTEKNYFPIHIAGQFKAQANESQAKAAAGFSSMSNAGFTHAQNPNAKAPFVMEGFNDVWADHVNEMSRYHGTVPALEDMRKVMNRSSYSESGMESMSVKQMMENSFGKEAVDYFDNLYREANSGAITDKLQKWPKKLLSLFRKNSVAYSLSVLVQQPASLVRAYALIDRKYFGFKGFGAITTGVAKAVSNKWTKAHTNAYNEMLKYAPGVTMAKEIGGFDTATGGSIRSYLLDTGKSFKQSMKTENLKGKAGAVMDLVDDNAIANLPNVADKIAWIEIWNACKRETVAKRKDLATSSEEFMQIVGERFTEVIRATQVYDSIFAKSPMLKSKNLAVQYLVSFMNEPNTTANMVEKAMRDITKGDWKSGARTATVVIHSIIFTNVLKSIIYAMRDDDEDETYIEKYLEAISGGLINDFIPFNYIPIARDVWSLAQGYDVERADMAIVADAVDALSKVVKNAFTETEDMTEEELVAFDKKVTEANWKLVESLASFLGIPVKNIRREIDGVLDHAKIASANAGMTTSKSVWDKVYDSVIDSIPFMSNKHTKADKLYEAIISGDKTYVERLKSTYKDYSAYQSAVRKALKENDPRIHVAAQARYDGNIEEYKRVFREIQKEGKFTFDDIMSAVNSEVSAIRNKLEPDKATSQYSAGDFVESVAMGNTTEAQAMRENIIATKVANGKTQEEAEKEFASDVATDIGKAYSSGLLDEAQAEKMLVEYAGKDEEEAASKVSYWAFCEEHSGYKDVLTEANVAKYYEFAEPAKIPVEVYAQFITGTKGLTDIKDKWGDVEVTKREQVLEVIDSLPLTWQQKDALYLAYPYAESQIWDVPW